jgi:hypothetical protein
LFVKVLQVLEVEPRWMQPANACRYSGLPWDLIEEGIADGHIRVCYLRSRRSRLKKAARVIQLVSTESLVFFIEHFAELYAGTEAVANDPKSIKRES